MADERRPGGDPRGPFVVAPERAVHGRGPRLPMGALGLLAVAVVALTTWGLLAPAPPAPSSAPPTARASGPDASSPASPDQAPPVMDDALSQLAAEAGWADCPIWRGFGVGAEVSSEQVELAIAAPGAEAWRIEVDDLQGGTTPVWLDVDAEALVRRLGGIRAVGDGESVWTVLDGVSGAPVAVKLSPGTTSAGRTYWVQRARATPAPYCFDMPAGTLAAVIEVGPSSDALARLFVEMGLNICRTWRRMETEEYPSAMEVDRAAALLPGGSQGWVPVPVIPGYGGAQVRTWIGGDVAVAGAAHGASIVVLQAGDPSIPGDPGRAWMAVTLDGRPAAVQFRVLDTQAGTRAWLPTPNAAGAIGDCQPPRPDGAPDAEAPASPVGAATVELLRGGETALGMLSEHFGWTGCRISGPGGLDESGLQRFLEGLDAAVPKHGRRTRPARWSGAPG